VHNAWLRAVEDGIHTYDIYDESVSKQKVGTNEFATAVIERLGQTPQILKPRKYKAADAETLVSKPAAASPTPKKEMVGVDVFLDWTKGSANDLGGKLSELSGDGLKLTMISNRGVKVWPEGHAETFCSDHWRCRFRGEGGDNPVSHGQVISLLNRIAAAGYDFIKTEGLYMFDGERGFSLDQGE